MVGKLVAAAILIPAAIFIGTPPAPPPPATTSTGETTWRIDPPRHYTYGDLARAEKARCLRNKGEDQWSPSLGVTLEQFCDTVGWVAAGNEHRRAHKY